LARLYSGDPIYNINRFVLQESGILLGECLTVKNLVGVAHRWWMGLVL